ncbi:sulfatase [Coraliomargarita sp. SDUM461004]|uniref:Sulfatase n=1 Tax=Thalassobacterium sedimentorum TaxID=3041258 RepID=A0ABU1AE85_9BACT|nr:sulfatase [Coraliomargarita sp. SDUM461004]MDQ8192922.1 sulfatase [Coraliomargarita sp. SDUM461004]
MADKKVQKRIYTLLLLLLPIGIHAAQPNFIIIVADDMSWTDSGAYGHPTIKTPNIDQMALDGMRFDQAFLTTSSCSPSRASIMTGRYPHNTGAPELHSEMPATQVMLTKVLKEAGYYTASVGKWHLGENVRDQFDLIIEDKEGAGTQQWIKTLQERPANQPFFLWLASNDPHRVYSPEKIKQSNSPSMVVVPPHYPDTAEVRKDLANYYNEISRLDHDLGRVRAEVAAQGITKNTFILFLSDNGRPFPASKTRLTDEGIRTPFIITYPQRVQSNTTTSSLISTIDIFPTIADIANIPIPSTVSGKSFLAVLENPQNSIRNRIYAEHNWHDYQAYERAVRNERYTYIRNALPELAATPPADAVGSPTYQAMRKLRDAGELTALQMDSFTQPRAVDFLYDNIMDPYSTVNLANKTEYQSILKTLSADLDKWIQSTNDVMPKELTPDLFDRETGRMLPIHRNYMK